MARIDGPRNTASIWHIAPIVLRENDVLVFKVYYPTILLYIIFMF